MDFSPTLPGSQRTTNVGTCRGGEEPGPTKCYLSAAGLCMRRLRLAGCWDTRTRSRDCRIARLLIQRWTPLEELLWLVAGDRGSSKFSESAMLCNSFPFWKSRSQQRARAAALFKHREPEFLSYQYILSADSAGATHRHVVNADSCPLSQQECMLILTQRQRPEPSSELLSGPTRWWEAERIQGS